MVMHYNLDAIITQKDVRFILCALQDRGYQAFVVGGAVRNALLDIPASDVDICTDAIPDVVTRVFEGLRHKVIPTGITHGTVSVVSSGTPYEITTFRRDVSTDGRRATVAFSSSISDDAERRDFTMNALYLDMDGKIHDPSGQGIADASDRYLRFIGNPDRRIQEDALRILRYFRLNATLDFSDDSAPRHADDNDARRTAMSCRIEMLDQISRERVGSEMRKLLGARSCVNALKSMDAIGALTTILPSSRLGKSLVRLEAMELHLGIAPNWQRRLHVLESDLSLNPMRFSKVEAEYHIKMTKILMCDITGVALGYYGGARIGLDAMLLRCASGHDFCTDEYDMILEGSAAKFPLRASDLPRDLQGSQIGAALRECETRWVISGFSLTLPEMLIDFASGSRQETILFQ